MKAMHMLKGAGQGGSNPLLGRALQGSATLPGSHPSRRKLSSTIYPEASKLTFADLYQASTLSRWSGLCYKPANAIPALVQAEGLEFVAQGRTSATSWIIADGCIDFEPFVESMLSTMSLSPNQAALCRESFQKTVQRTISATQSGYRQGEKSWSVSSKPLPSQHSSSKDSGALHAQPAGSTGVGCSQPADQSPGPWCLPPQRFIFVRGVQWSAVDTQHYSQLAAALSNFLPTPFAGPPNSDPAEASLVAHSGVSSIATELYTQLLPYLSERRQESRSSSGVDVPLPLCFAGHSLGGALCMLLLAQHRAQFATAPNPMSTLVAGQDLPLPPKPLHARHQRMQQQWLDAAHTFGSPPVIAHKDGGGGYKVLQALGLPDGAIRSFVQQHDPIPRVLLTADPTYHAMVRFVPGMQQLLQLRGWLLGGAPGSITGDAADARGTAAVFTPSRFMFENVGSIYLIKGGAEITPMGSPSDMDDWASTQISAAEFLLAQPARALRGWLDHHHGSYQHDLEIAALVELKREARSVLSQLQAKRTPLL